MHLQAGGSSGGETSDEETNPSSRTWTGYGYVYESGLTPDQEEYIGKFFDSLTDEQLEELRNMSAEDYSSYIEQLDKAAEDYNPENN